MSFRMMAPRWDDEEEDTYVQEQKSSYDYTSSPVDSSRFKHDANLTSQYTGSTYNITHSDSQNFTSPNDESSYKHMFSGSSEHGSLEHGQMGIMGPMGPTGSVGPIGPIGPTGRVGNSLVYINTDFIVRETEEVVATIPVDFSRYSIKSVLISSDYQGPFNLTIRTSQTTNFHFSHKCRKNTESIFLNNIDTLNEVLTVEFVAFNEPFFETLMNTSTIKSLVVELEPLFC